MAPTNTFECINFLIEVSFVSDNKMLYSETENERSNQEKWFSCGNVEYNEYAKNTKNFTKMFRNVSMIKYAEKTLSEYEKTTYFEESNDFIKNGFRYKFGNALDHSNNTEITSRISTQICRDLVMKVRETDPKTRIHIVPSNSINIFQNIEKIVGTPKTIIHADPLYQEVLVPSFKKDIDNSIGKISKIIYNSFPYKVSFTFKIEESNEYKNSYTITHWILPEGFH